MESFTVSRRKLLKLGLAAGAGIAAWTAGLLPEITSASVSAEGLQKMPTDAKRVAGPGLRQILNEAYDDERVRALRSKAVELGYSHLPYAAEPVVIDAGNNRQIAHITFASQNSASKDFFYIQVVRENAALTTVQGSTVHYLRSSASTAQEAKGAIDVSPVQIPITPKPLLGGVIDALAWGPSCPNNESAGCCWLDCTLSCCGPAIIACIFAGPAFPVCAAAVCGLWCVNWCLGWTCANCHGGTYC